MEADEQLAPDRVKHLEMIQAVIARLGSDSFLIKGWAVTVTGVFLGFTVNSRLEGLAGVAAAVVIFFWALDTYYLRSERLFRLLFLQARTGSVELFEMDATSKPFTTSLQAGDRSLASYPKTLLRPTLRWLYLGLLAACGAVALIVGSSHNSSPSNGSAKQRAEICRKGPETCVPRSSLIRPDTVDRIVLPAREYM